MESIISPANHVRLNPDVLARRLDGGAVFVHLSTNRIFELNETAARIWDLVIAGSSLEAIAHQLAEEYDVEPDEAREEVDRLIERFRGEGFLLP